MTEPLLLYCMIITSSIVNITIIIIHIQSKKSCMLNGHWIINRQFRYTSNSREALTMKYKLIFDILWECWHRKLYLNTSTNTVQINRNIISCRSCTIWICSRGHNIRIISAVGVTQSSVISPSSLTPLAGAGFLRICQQL